MQFKRRTKKPVNKKVRNATPLKYHNILFKSNLEVHCYKALKDANLNFQYEKHRYELISPFTFTNTSYELFKRKGKKTFGQQRNNIRGITYTPDFVGEYHGQMFIIETKGNPNDAFPIRWKLFKRYLLINNIDANLYMPRNQKQINETIEIIKADERLLQDKKSK